MRINSIRQTIQLHLAEPHHIEREERERDIIGERELP
jgi:hypothetical protein